MEKKAKAPLILAGCGCASLIVAAALFGSAFFFFRDARGTLASREDTYIYRNTRDGRTGVLAENYVDFEFRYPTTWVPKPQDADSVNFFAVERADAGRTLENFNVGYFDTAGSKEGNEQLYPQLIAQLQGQFSQQFQDLRKIDEGKTKVGEYEGYQGLFASKAGEADVYTRVILLPTPDGAKGVTLLMMGTSFSPDLEKPDDLAKKGDLPSILESFRFM